MSLPFKSNFSYGKTGFFYLFLPVVTGLVGTMVVAGSVQIPSTKKICITLKFSNNSNDTFLEHFILFKENFTYSISLVSSHHLGLWLQTWRHEL